ncbi:UDP-glucuronosyl/UDP-glucosyltransferase [Trema orientale]|uniref:UDP-glucuronosyl/UDP-glucosyltransferase n=1 Tax=Trema orientale TaxID=63057 RepID=A0A2P5ED57_TREOI|nr:UDP-glucuronosyl/UDP-glucosyltransferase [Trema orientale]
MSSVDDDDDGIRSGNQIRVALIEDGLSLEDRVRPGKLSESVLRLMPGKSLGWALDIAERKGIKRVAFSPAAVAHLLQAFSIPKFIDQGITLIQMGRYYNRLDSNTYPLSRSEHLD